MPEGVAVGVAPPAQSLGGGTPPVPQALGGAQASVPDLIKTSPTQSPADDGDDDGDGDDGGTPVQHADSDPQGAAVQQNGIGPLGALPQSPAPALTLEVLHNLQMSDITRDSTPSLQRSFLEISVSDASIMLGGGWGYCAVSSVIFKCCIIHNRSIMNPYIGGLVLWRPHAIFQSLRVWVWYHVKQVVRDGGMCGVHACVYTM